MKNLFKNKKVVITVSVALTLVLIAGTVFCLTRHKNMPKNEISDLTVSETPKDVVVDSPDDSDTTGSDNNTVVGEIADDGSGLKPDEGTETESSNRTDKKVSAPAAPKTETTPQETAKPSAGITIGGGVPTDYNCGCAGHHCSGPETHAFIENLEIEGCPYCGLHSCPSFYATDAWGNTCYTPSCCPKYDITKDEVYYCQKCGKKCGDGLIGTCVQFVNACYCPNCGKYVDARTCHTCE